MKIEIYSKEDCSFCEKVKRACEIKNLEYTEIKMTSENISDLHNRVGQNVRTMPQVFVNDKYIGGHREFMKYISENA